MSEVGPYPPYSMILEWDSRGAIFVVTVPVKLFSAVQQKDISFHQIDAKSGSRIRYKRVSEKTGSASRLMRTRISTNCWRSGNRW